MEEAIGELEEQISEARIRNKEETDRARAEEERNKQSLPRFETLQEKSTRLKHERELREFGEVAISFRLSHLNPKYTYFLNGEGSRNNTSTVAAGTTGLELQQRGTESCAASISSKKRKTVHYNEPVARMVPLALSGNEGRTGTVARSCGLNTSSNNSKQLLV